MNPTSPFGWVLSHTGRYDGCVNSDGRRGQGIAKASEYPYKHLRKWSNVMGNGIDHDEKDAEVEDGHV